MLVIIDISSDWGNNANFEAPQYLGWYCHFDRKRQPNWEAKVSRVSGCKNEFIDRGTEARIANTYFIIMPSALSLLGTSQVMKTYSETLQEIEWERSMKFRYLSRRFTKQIFQYRKRVNCSMSNGPILAKCFKLPGLFKRIQKKKNELSGVCGRPKLRPGIIS